MAHSGTKLDWTELDSSNVQAVAYDEGSRTLVVQFNGGSLYSYDDVDQDVYADLVHAESVGKYLNQMVKGRYSYLKWFNEQDIIKHLSKAS